MRYFKQVITQCSEGCPYFGQRPMDTSMWGRCDEAGRIIYNTEVFQDGKVAFPDWCPLEEATNDQPLP